LWPMLVVWAMWRMWAMWAVWPRGLRPGGNGKWEVGSGDGDRRRASAGQTADEAWRLVEGANPGAVGLALFERAQEIMERERAVRVNRCSRGVRVRERGGVGAHSSHTRARRAVSMGSEPSRAEQGRAGQSGAEPSRARPSRAEQARAGPAQWEGWLVSWWGRERGNGRWDWAAGRPGGPGAAGRARRGMAEEARCHPWPRKAQRGAVRGSVDGGHRSQRRSGSGVGSGDRRWRQLKGGQTWATADGG
jgi:hypothetical protein